MTSFEKSSSQVVLNYLYLAHEDYVVSRHLLREGYLDHGAMLAATAVEKYLKAVIGFSGISNRDHLGNPLFKLVERCQPQLYASLDKTFLKFLQKAYKLRYASASSPGLAIVLNQYRILIGLDEAIACIDKGFKLGAKK
ncbi:MAG: HEPN domain-containing protein [Variovorax sp.]|nr:MAG: HEPN domain-containing protein [Variovorax sp.]